MLSTAGPPLKKSTMKRNELTEALRAASGAEGYAFHTGPARLINGEVRIYPAVWLEPPAILSAAGRCEGDIAYRITAHLMTLPAKADERETLWAKLERDALAIARRLTADACIRDVSGISSTPAARSLTVHGEVSVTIKCDVTVWYSI